MAVSHSTEVAVTHNHTQPYILSLLVCVCAYVCDVFEGTCATKRIWWSEGNFQNPALRIYVYVGSVDGT